MAWRANVPLEGAIYAESIPFDETRGYVLFRANAREAGEDPYYMHNYRVALDGSGLAMLDAAPPFTRSADWMAVSDAPGNNPPVAFAGPDGNVDCAGRDGAWVVLDGSGSSDGGGSGGEDHSPGGHHSGEDD